MKRLIILWGLICLNQTQAKDPVITLGLEGEEMKHSVTSGKSSTSVSSIQWNTGVNPAQIEEATPVTPAPAGLPLAGMEGLGGTSMAIDPGGSAGMEEIMTFASGPATPASTRGLVIGADGSMETVGVPVFSKYEIDPFDPAGTMGRYPNYFGGPVSLQMILAYYGVEKSRDYLAFTDVGAGPMWVAGKGTTHAGLIAMAKSLGFAGSQKRMFTAAALKSFVQSSISEGRPQIISVRGKIKHTSGVQYQSDPTGNLMVVTGIAANGNLMVHDPEKGCKAEISFTDFQAIFNGYAFEIKK